MPLRRLSKTSVLALSCLLACAPRLAAAQTVAASSLADLSLEQLGNIQVTLVSGRPETLQEAAASIFVITSEDIRRSAATSLPEALRLAPNLQVARLNAGQYAISARGFNNAIGNKLLVMVDGRTVYSPLFSGVFWDAQDVPLQDIERIEVVSGPGATLWGANAVNGVINVVTHAAGETQGLLAAATGGPEGSTASLRYGGTLGGDGRYRVYAMRLNRNDTVRVDGVHRPDASSKEQVGFRADWDGAERQFGLQGDAYHAGSDMRSNLAPGLSGANLLARWRGRRADGSSWQWQAYLDRERRDDAVLFNARTETFDLQFSHAPATPPEHKLLWGAGYRRARSEALATRFDVFDPALRTLAWSNVFAQDEVRVGQRLRLTGGAKLEHNDYTGLEVLPSVRAALDVGEEALLWASLSRTVRAPARLDRDFFFPAQPPFQIRGGADFRSEVADVAELGWRARPTPAFGYSLTAFHHQYRRLRGGTPAPTAIENRIAGSAAGVEGWGSLDLTRTWRLAGGFVALRKSLEAAPGTSPNSIADLGNDPRRQWLLRSSMDLPGHCELDVTLRHVGSLPAPAVEAYTATDLRLSWQPRADLSLSLLVQNLFDPGHIEFNAPAVASQIPRSAWLALEWRM